MDLALELLAAFPALMWSSRVVVLADADFGVLDKAAPSGLVRSTEFIQGCQALGFKQLLVGVRCNRQLADGRQFAELKQRGVQVIRHDLREQPLWLSWCDVRREEGKKRFYEHRGEPHPPQWGCYVASTFSAGGAYLARRYRQRWLIESFFKSIKHDFGLKEARLRTQTVALPTFADPR